MLELACQAWCRPLAPLAGALVTRFVFVDRHVPALRRHGYLLATVATKSATCLERKAEPRREIAKDDEGVRLR